MKVTLRQLQVFDAVSATGSVTKAAEKLNMSQSAASISLNDLQIILRRPLFTRSNGRRLQMTDEGRRLRPIVRSLLSEVQDIELGDELAPPQGKLVVGATSTIAELVLPRLCVEFMRLYPDVHVEVQTEAVGELFERLERMELETALVEIFPKMEGIDLTPWRRDELVLVVAPDHPLAQRKRMKLKDLAGYSWCTRESYSSISSRLRYTLEEHVGQFPVAFECASNLAVFNAVVEGGGIGCLSELQIETALRTGRLCRLNVTDFRLTRALSIARPKDIWRSRLASAFDRFLAERADPRALSEAVQNPSLL